MTGDTLKAWRESEGLTQQKASELAGVNIRTWQRYEDGTYPVPQWLRPVLVSRYGSAWSQRHPHTE